MADLIRKNDENPPEPKGTGKKITAAVLLIIAVFCGIVFFSSHSLAALIIGVISLFGSFVLFAATATFAPYTPEHKAYGDLGERRTGFILEKYLPEGYTVIQNAKVVFDGKKSEIDNIVISKTGVFIIEVKNMKGTVYGDFDERYWVKDKIDRYNYEHEKDFYSPVKQVGTHIYRLANYLRDNKVFTHISGAVYFANPGNEVVLSGEEKDIPVFTYRTTKGLLNYIKSGDANLTEKTIKKITDLLV